MTTVQLADGSSYVIPVGDPGTARWAREASLIAVAYQQAGDFGNAYKWKNEYVRRWNAYLQIENGADLQAVINSGSWLTGPRLILAYAAKTVSTIVDAAGDLVSTAAKAPGVALDVVRWVPLVAIGLLAVVAFGFHKQGLKVRL